MLLPRSGTGWGKKGYPADYIFYCYGSHLMTTRKPNENETSLNLSTVCQAMGTKADGGHSGAATCKPASNPNFPLEQLDKVRDTQLPPVPGVPGRRGGGLFRIEV